MMTSYKLLKCGLFVPYKNYHMKRKEKKRKKVQQQKDDEASEFSQPRIIFGRNKIHTLLDNEVHFQ